MVHKNSASYLFKRGDTYYFSKQIPVDIRHNYTRSRIVICLKTACERSAIKASHSVLQRLDEYWMQLRIKDIDPSLLTDGPSYGGVLWWGDAKIAQAIDAALAKRTGAILPLITGQPDVGHAHEERHICIDTTASGGNATLLGEVS